MPEIPEETLCQWEMSPSTVTHGLAIAEIRRQREVIADAERKRYTQLVRCRRCGRTFIFTRLNNGDIEIINECCTRSAAAKARDEWLKAEGAAEAYEAEAVGWDSCAVNARTTESRDCYQIRAYEARKRAAQLREEAGR